MAEIEKFDIQSMNIKQEQIEKFKTLFPEIFTESNKIDWERLKLTLGEDIDTGKERYGMNWPGKADCYKTIQQPSIATLIPVRDESIDFDTTQNLFIEGDNLEVLKLLQKSYLAKIKMIYIDPPYNTGGDFIYPDNYTENLQTYLEYTGQVDNEGRKFGTNTDTDGRFHSKWMNMMYPRLFLAKNLLKDDGVIFISIDDSEQGNLRQICNEIFGEENLLAQIIWEKKYSPQNDAKYFSDSHEFVLAYSKNKENFSIGMLPRTDEANSRYKNLDDDPRGPWKSSDLTRQEYRPNDDYEIVSPKTGKRFPPPKGCSWGRPKDKIEELIIDNRIWFGNDGNSVPSLKRFLTEVKQGITPQTIWFREDVGDTQEGKKIIKELLENVSIFETPKPPRLIQKCMLTANVINDDIVLDFFAGSSSTAQAVMELNYSSKANVKFICVQLPELTDDKSEAYKAGYKTIADIGKVRIQKVINKLKSEIEAEKKKPKQLQIGNQPGLLETFDLGCKVFKLAISNFKVWDSNIEKTPDAIQLAIQHHIEHINENATQETLLYEILLKAGFELTTTIRELSIQNKSVFSVSDGQLLICLEKEITHELIKSIAELQPIRVVCLDEGFHNNDQLKTNAVQIMKSKGVVKFQTV